MAQNTPILGKIKSSESAASLDAKYGPYASKAAANAALGENGDDVITAGLTVGVTQSDGSVKEFWYQPDGQGGFQLVEKQVAAQEETDPTVPAWAKQETKPSYTAGEVGAISSSEKGVAGGVATLGSDGKVPQAQLPSYVDDVLEYSNQSSFPATGESGKIYVALDTNKTYRWSGSAYVEISQSLALGETSSTAFAGDRGKAIEDKIPSNASSSNKMVTANDISGKVDKVANVQENNFASFDANGCIKDSGCNEGTFIKGVKQNGTLITPVSGVVDVTVQDGEDGLSAFEIAQQQGYTGTVDQWLASLKANIGEFLFVSTDAAAVTAMATIGQTYSSAIDPQGKNVAPAQNTLSVILLMNDDATTPSKTMMIATQDDGSSGYEFIYAGDLQSAMPSNVLTENDIVDNLNSTNATKALSAKQGKVLADITLIAPPTEQTINLKSDVVWLNGFYSIDEDGSLHTQESVFKTSDYINLPSNVKTINYKGGTATTSYYKQVAIYNDSNECLGTFFKNQAENGVSFDVSNLVGATKMRISEYYLYINNSSWDLSIVVVNEQTNQEVFEDFSQSIDDRFDEVNEHLENLDDNYYLIDSADIETNLKYSVVWLEGYNFIDANGDLSPVSSIGKVSEYINLPQNTKSIKYKGGVDTQPSHYHCAIYDAQDNCLATFRDSTASNTNAVVFDITLYPTATKMRISEYSLYIDRGSWDLSIIYHQRQTNKETYDELLDWIDSLNQWKGKKFIAFGASNTSVGFSDGTSWIQMAAKKLKMQPPISGMVSRRVSLKYVDGSLNLVGLAATIAECQSISASTTISYETQFAKDFDCVLFGGFAGESYDESQVVIDGTTYYGGEELIDLVKLPTTKYNNNPHLSYSNGDTLAQHRDSYIGAVIFVLNELWKVKPTCRVVFARAYLHWKSYDEFSRNFIGIKKLCDKLHLPFIDLVEGVYFNGFTTGNGVEDITNPNVFLYDEQHASLAGRQRLGNIFTHKLLLIS